MTVTDSALHRMHRALVEALRERDPVALQHPFTVAEIYQDLIPYGTHRDRLEVEMNGDYEHLLMRLLSGEGELVVLESEPARRELDEELQEPNPNTGLYREYAGVDVRLVVDRIPDDLVVDAPEGDAGPAEEEPALAPVIDVEPETPERAAEAVLAEETTPASLWEDDAAPSRARVGDEDGNCRWCRAELPKRDNLNYCPWCGQDARLVPCPSCGDAMEPEWRFCIVCGAEAATA